MLAKLSLSKIHCIDEADSFGKAEPYLWPFYFKIDGQTLTFLARDAGKEAVKDRVIPLLRGNDNVIESLTDSLIDNLINQAPNSLNWFHAPGGAHGNLGGNMDAGDTREVPADLGQWQCELEGLVLLGQNALTPGAARVGVVAVLLEEDMIPDDKIPGAYNSFRDKVAETISEQALNELATGLADALADLIPNLDRAPAAGSGGSGSGDSASGLVDDIKDALDDQVPGYINRDDVIGGIIQNWTADELVQADYSGTTLLEPPMSEDGKYRITLEAEAWADLSAPAVTTWTQASRPPLAAARDSEGANSLAVFRWRNMNDLFAGISGFGSIFGLNFPPGLWQAIGDLGDLSGGSLGDRKPVLWTWNVDHTEHACIEMQQGDRRWLVELWRPYGRAWRRSDGIAQLTRQNAPSGPACAWTWSHDKTQHVAFRSDNALTELWFLRGNGWRHGSSLTSATQGTGPKAKAPAPFTLSQSQHLLYIGGNDEVFEAWFKQGWGWKVRNLSEDHGVVSNAKDLAATAEPGKPGILIVRDNQGRLHDYTLNSPGGSWSAGTLSQTVSGAAEGAPSVTYGRRHRSTRTMPWVAFRHGDSKIQLVTQLGNSWDIHNTPSHPAAESDPVIASWDDKIFTLFAVQGHGRTGSLILQGNNSDFIGGKS
ncbi:hypothetical protein [Alcanivorax sp.]|uniref:hypothetical protein n=1 Tax=Alcanivorax sp. TaxID=1872427 RepID=UPI0032D935D3